MYKDLIIHLGNNNSKLDGPWVQKKSNYEEEACKALNIQCQKSRYSDASWGKFSIELKKGTSIWLDLVRYSELLLEKHELNSAASVTLFLVPDKDKKFIIDIYGVSTPKLISALNLNPEAAEKVLWLRDKAPRC